MLLAQICRSLHRPYLRALGSKTELMKILNSKKQWHKPERNGKNYSLNYFS